MPAENEIPENEDVRKKALLRLAVAGVVTATALGGLWWLDQSSSKQKKAAPETSIPTPIVAAPQPEVPAPETEAPSVPPEDSASTQAAPPDQTAPAPNGKFVSSAPPPPRVSNTPGNAQRTPNTAQPIAPPPQPAPAAGKGYVVQLGVFTNPDNARELVEKLNKQGVRAHLEARVQIGPFLNRQEAEKAQTEMRKLGYNALVTLPYSSLPATK
ncbi:MAG: SPOR domain-containing protein [Pseudomonadota bacterium]|nr:SPOR domain-containing protein [Pseudomonadota bacterium]